MPALNANQKIKKQMALWERRVRNAVKRCSARGEIWQSRQRFDRTRTDYWSSNHSATKAERRLEDRGTIIFKRLRNSRGGYVAKGYALNPGRTKVVKVTKKKVGV
ncbi:MAG TPA: hypothetical protein VFH61_07295 [Thermoleophilia bacterium]|nr:hypothetical protein [Thermoleophilia bacterium]